MAALGPNTLNHSADLFIQRAGATRITVTSTGLTLAGNVVLSTQGTVINQAVRADRNIGTGTGLTGGGNLTANRTLSVDVTVYRRANILGAVSQSGGTPTGAIIQQGGNANGTFTRFADGTQICHRRDFGLMVRGNSYTWTYPAAFSALPTCSGNSQTRGGGSDGPSDTWTVNFGSNGATGIANNSVTITPTGGSNASFRACLTAIGRWF
jgi:hypothetical protein